MYAPWLVAYDETWDFVVTGSGGDSAVIHFWGMDQDGAFRLGSGQSAEVHAYVGTQLFWIDPQPNTNVPALNLWGCLGLAAVLGLFILLRQRS